MSGDLMNTPGYTPSRAISGKTGLHVAIGNALGEMQINWNGNLFSDADDLSSAHEIIERHIAPLLKSARIAAIEEAARVCEGWDGNEPPDLDSLPDTWGWHAKDWAKAIRALKEQP